MKTLKILSYLLVGLFLFSGVAQAQLQPEKKQQGELRNIPNLSQEQKTQIKEIMESNRDALKTLRQEKRQAKQEFKKMMTADAPEISAIEAQIDDISRLEAKEWKLMAVQAQKIRSLLNEKQRAYFDKHFMKRLLPENPPQARKPMNRKPPK